MRLKVHRPTKWLHEHEASFPLSCLPPLLSFSGDEEKSSESRLEIIFPKQVREKFTYSV